VQTEPRIYSISEAARKLDLSADWLRQGERRGSIPPAKRDSNGCRFYTVEDIGRLRELGVGERKKASVGRARDVQRRHEVDDQACLQALKLLLRRASRPGDSEGEAHRKAITRAFTGTDGSTSTSSSLVTGTGND
jgi:DNA-binding transcriptional MerR regulator